MSGDYMDKGLDKHLDQRDLAQGLERGALTMSLPAHLHLSSCLPADTWISRICAMSIRPPPLLPGQLRQPRQVDLSVTFHTADSKLVTS